jgi:hypothetical protein
MRGKYPKKLSKFVPPELDRALHQGLGQMYELYPVWTQIVGHKLAVHSRPLAHIDQCLVVQVESPVWAAAMRQRQQSVLARLREVDGMGQTREIRIRVSPTPVPVGPLTSARQPAEPVSASAAEAIARTAAAVEDPALKKALQRLYSSTRGIKKEDDG